MRPHLADGRLDQSSVTETPIPERVTNKDLFKMQLESLKERKEMEARLTKEIVDVSDRLIKVELKMLDVEEIKADLKKRDNYGYIGTIVAGIMAGFGIWDK